MLTMVPTGLLRGINPAFWYSKVTIVVHTLCTARSSLRRCARALCGLHIMLHTLLLPHEHAGHKQRAPKAGAEVCGGP
jgi:hypothetical protein